MKKIIYLLFATLMICCNSKKDAPKDTLKEDAEKLLISELNDPSSYEFVSFEVDTLKRQMINQRIQDLASMLEKYKKNEQKNKQNISTVNDEIESAKAKELPKNQIEFSFKYRAKNGFNATVLNEKTVVCDSEYNFKEMY